MAANVDFLASASKVGALDDLRPTSLLIEAIAALRSGHGSCGFAVSGERETSAESGSSGPDGTLLRFARGHGLVSSEERLALLSPLEGGNEHEIFHEPDTPGVILKVTEPALRLRNGRDRIPKVTALHYLERWHLANLAFGDVAALAMVIETSQGIRIGIRQPFVAAADPYAPNPSQTQINRWLRVAGFDYQSGAWIRKEDSLVMVDTHEGNFILSPAGIRPVDVELFRLGDVSGPVVPWKVTQQRLLAEGLVPVG